MAEPIEIAGLVKSYGEPVLDHLDLTVSGGVVALLGPNGAGKTTLVSILTTLVRPDAGTARIGGIDVVRDPAGVRRLVTATDQETTLDDLLTGHENLMMLGRLLGLGPRARARARADELIEQVDLVTAANRRVSTYSGGMRRRLDLAASFITQPYVLFLDEPTTGLDPVSRRRIWDDVRTLATTGTTVFLTTQTLDEAEALADRIVVLRQGTIVADGTAAELTAVVGGQRIDLLDANGHLVRSIETDGSAGSIERALADLASHERELQIALHSPTLDDAFVALTREDEVVAA